MLRIGFQICNTRTEILPGYPFLATDARNGLFCLFLFVFVCFFVCFCLFFTVTNALVNPPPHPAGGVFRISTKGVPSLSLAAAAASKSQLGGTLTVGCGGGGGNRWGRGV